MCSCYRNNGIFGNDSWWIIIVIAVILLWCCGGNGCGSNYGNNLCGASDNCGCGCGTSCC